MRRPSLLLLYLENTLSYNCLLLELTVTCLERYCTGVMLIKDDMSRGNSNLAELKLKDLGSSSQKSGSS